MTFADAQIEAAKVAEGLMVAGITQAGVTFIMVSGCKTVYEFGEDYGCLVGPRIVDVLKATSAEIESSRLLEAERIARELAISKPKRAYRRRY